MKNVQVIDGAPNCTFPIFQFEDDQFLLIFSDADQDIAFADELETYLSDAELKRAFEGVWDRPIAKIDIGGLHGTLFYEFEAKKCHFPASRRECDWDELSINAAQRELHAMIRAKLSK